MISPTVIAIPLFAVMIALEAHLALWLDSDEFSDKKDTKANIILGFSSTAWAILLAILASYIYFFCYEISLFKFPADAWWSWVILFFIDDPLGDWLRTLRAMRRAAGWRWVATQS